MPSTHLQIIQPAHFPPPRGFANGIVSIGRTLYVAGQIGWETDRTFKSTDFADQFARALDNVLDVVRAAGGTPGDLVKMTVYVTNLAEYRAAANRLGVLWRQRLDKHYPAMALVAVTGLVEELAKVEIEAIATLP